MRKTPLTQPAQKVHSNEQILASSEFGGRALPQFSQVGRSSSTLQSLFWIHGQYAEGLGSRAQLDDSTQQRQQCCADWIDSGMRGSRLLGNSQYDRRCTLQWARSATRKDCAASASAIGSARPRATPLPTNFGAYVRVLRDACKPAWPNFLASIKRKDNILPTFARQIAVRSRLLLYRPRYAQQRAEQARDLDRWSLTHTVNGNEMLIATGGDPLCSRRSAMARSANTSALAIASSAVFP